jgi:hypothetical protein
MALEIYWHLPPLIFPACSPGFQLKAGSLLICRLSKPCARCVENSRHWGTPVRRVRTDLDPASGYVRHGGRLTLERGNRRELTRGTSSWPSAPCRRLLPAGGHSSRAPVDTLEEAQAALWLSWS